MNNRKGLIFRNHEDNISSSFKYYSEDISSKIFAKNVLSGHNSSRNIPSKIKLKPIKNIDNRFQKSERKTIPELPEVHSKQNLSQDYIILPSSVKNKMQAFSSGKTRIRLLKKAQSPSKELIEEKRKMIIRRITKEYKNKPKQINVYNNLFYNGPDYRLENIINQKKYFENGVFLDPSYYGKRVEDSQDYFKIGGIIPGSTIAKRIKTLKITERYSPLNINLGIKLLDRKKIYKNKIKKELFEKDVNYVKNLEEEEKKWIQDYIN